MAKQDNVTPVEVIKKLDELRMKYKFMEQNQLAKKNKLNTQIPDIQNNLEVLRMLKDKKVCAVIWTVCSFLSMFLYFQAKNTEFETSYLLDYHVYSRATVTPTDNVGLWLGVSGNEYLLALVNNVNFSPNRQM